MSEIGHRKRTGAAARRLVRRRRQMLARDLLGHPEGGVVLDPPPDDHQEPPARAGRAAQVGHRRRRVGEEHGPEAREADVERPFELHRLSVGELERGARDAGARGVGAADGQERLAAVDPQRASGRAGELDGRLAEAAPHVQHPLALVDGVHLQRALAVDGEPVGQHPPEAGELRHQDLVPDPDRLRVRRACFRHVSRIPATPTLRTKKHNELQFDDNCRSKVAAMTISGLVVGTYLAVLLVLAMYGFHRSSLVWLYYRNRHRRPRPLGQFAELPAVTVQLPLFNEMYVVERLLDAVARHPLPARPVPDPGARRQHRRDAGDLQAQDRRPRARASPSWRSSTSTASTAAASRPARCRTACGRRRASSS